MLAHANLSFERKDRPHLCQENLQFSKQFSWSAPNRLVSDLDLIGDYGFVVGNFSEVLRQWSFILFSAPGDFVNLDSSADAFNILLAQGSAGLGQGRIIAAQMLVRA